MQGTSGLPSSLFPGFPGVSGSSEPQPGAFTLCIQRAPHLPHLYKMSHAVGLRLTFLWYL